ncbi:hypothetical protein HDU93_004596, partial [Gonapodya sp. JEL0774]
AGAGTTWLLEEQERHQVQHAMQEKRRITIKRAMSKAGGAKTAASASRGTGAGAGADDSRSTAQQDSRGRDLAPAAESGNLGRKNSYRTAGGDRVDPFADPAGGDDSRVAGGSRGPYRLPSPNYDDGQTQVRRNPSQNQRRTSPDERDGGGAGGGRGRDRDREVDSRRLSQPKSSALYTVELPASFSPRDRDDEYESVRGGRPGRARSVPRSQGQGGLERSGSTAGNQSGPLGRAKSVSRQGGGVERGQSRRYYD